MITLTVADNFNARGFKDIVIKELTREEAQHVEKMVKGFMDLRNYLKKERKHENIKKEGYSADMPIL